MGCEGKLGRRLPKLPCALRNRPSPLLLSRTVSFPKIGIQDDFGDVAQINRQAIHHLLPSNTSSSALRALISATLATSKLSLPASIKRDFQ
ncbi:hypothetical protein NIES4073_12110 [Kalymmatonema gypsitolerans NIES-4073]|nr:hypothetical protein NIES4073_12110 [Scytonema sp. NIES-4073]